MRFSLANFTRKLTRCRKPQSKQASRKVSTGLRLNPETVNWIDVQVSKKRFANRTHAIEYALHRLKDETEKLERLLPQSPAA